MNQIEFSKLKEHIDKWIQLDYIYPEDIPAIELYMDQVTTFMEEQLQGNKRFDDDKILTKTMINNYSKNDLLPPSNKKRYSRDHIILLIYIYYLKSFLSINDIQHLLSPITEQYFHADKEPTLVNIYAQLFQLEQEYGIKVKESITDIYDIAANQFSNEDDYLKTFAMITLLSYDIYIKKQLVESLIDSLHPQPITKEERKDAKELVKQKEKAAKKEEKANRKQGKA